MTTCMTDSWESIIFDVECDEGAVVRAVVTNEGGFQTECMGCYFEALRTEEGDYIIVSFEFFVA